MSVRTLDGGPGDAGLGKRSGMHREGLETICHHAAWIGGFADVLKTAHSIGIPCGEDTEPWRSSFQGIAAPLHFQTLNAEPALAFAASFRACGELMEVLRPTPELDEDWRIVGSYLRSVADALESHHARTGARGLPSVADLEPTMAAILRTDVLATMVHPTGVARLRQAASAIEDYGRFERSGRLTEEEIEWIRSLAAGSRVVDVAAEFGLSRRAMYRALSEIWTKLGVEGRSQGLTLVARMGLLDDPATAATQSGTKVPQAN